MNILWGILIAVGVIYGTLTGNLGAVTDQALDSAKEAVSLCITMAGVMAFWMGMMEIAEDVGVIRDLTRRLSPVLSVLFPGLAADHPAQRHIRIPLRIKSNNLATNIIANLFGLGWAATPAGLSAMHKLQDARQAAVMQASCTRTTPDANTRKGAVTFDPLTTASDTMCDFLIFNISSLQLIPVNIIAYRSQYGSANPAMITGPAILATLCSTAAAILFIRVRYRIAASFGHLHTRRHLPPGAS